MSAPTIHVVTGAFGYSGRRIARQLLSRGHAVRTLTNAASAPIDLAGTIEKHPLQFHEPDRLVESLRGADVLYNTYWVRFNHGRFTRRQAVTNTLALFRAACDARVRRIVHVSIANPSEDSPFEYYRCKAVMERSLRESGISHAILRPTVLFGDDDILINNIAWILRRFPVFGVFGDGRYGIRPIHVNDFADLAVQCGDSREDVVMDAVGPERFTYRDLVETLARILKIKRWITSVPESLGFWIGRAIGAIVNDIVLTRDEIGALMSGLLDTNGTATGTTRLTEWAASHSETLGRFYHGELARRR